MEETTREIGGNTTSLWLGNKLTKWGDRLIKKGKKTIISNPTCKLLNPFTLMLNFTIDNNTKFQLILQGDYKERYKDFGTEDNPIGADEMFILITSNQKKWFLKG